MIAVRGLALCGVLALAACGGETKRETGGKADGEILPAAVSDAMLPYDTVRSQPPLAPSPESSDAGDDKANARPRASQETVAASEPARAEAPEPAEPAE